jgi:hypothetical protein
MLSAGGAGPCGSADLDHDGSVDENDLKLEIGAIFGAMLPPRPGPTRSLPVPPGGS